MKTFILFCLFLTGCATTKSFESQSSPIEIGSCVEVVSEQNELHGRSGLVIGKIGNSCLDKVKKSSCTKDSVVIKFKNDYIFIVERKDVQLSQECR